MDWYYGAGIDSFLLAVDLIDISMFESSYLLIMGIVVSSIIVV